FQAALPARPAVMFPGIVFRERRQASIQIYNSRSPTTKEMTAVSHEIAKYIDHTLLSPVATRADISKLCEEAKEHEFFAVCINPCHVRQAVRELSSSKVAVATVIGFPLGANLADIKIAETQRAVAEGAEEIDLVINVGALRDKEIDYVIEEIRGVVKASKD